MSDHMRQADATGEAVPRPGESLPRQEQRPDPLAALRRAQAIMADRGGPFDGPDSAVAGAQAGPGAEDRPRGTFRVSAD
jgi:hypothetical protein